MAYVQIWKRPPTQKLWTGPFPGLLPRPNLSQPIWMAPSRSWEHAVPALMNTNVLSQAVFIRTPNSSQLWTSSNTFNMVCSEKPCWHQACFQHQPASYSCIFTLWSCNTVTPQSSAGVFACFSFSTCKLYPRLTAFFRTVQKDEI